MRYETDATKIINRKSGENQQGERPFKMRNVKQNEIEKKFSQQRKIYYFI